MLKKIGMLIVVSMLVTASANASTPTWDYLKTKSKSEQTLFILGVFEGVATMAAMSSRQTMTCAGTNYSHMIDTSFKVLENSPQAWNKNLAAILVRIWKETGICR
jgi:hypothetical protein